MTSTRSKRSGYGLTLADFEVGQNLPEQSDPLAEIALGLAHAMRGFKRLKALRGDLTFRGSELVAPHLERAWRDLIQISRSLPDINKGETEESRPVLKRRYIRRKRTTRRKVVSK